MVTVLQDVVDIHSVIREPGGITANVKRVVIDITAFAIAAGFGAFNTAVDVEHAGIHPGFPAFIGVHIDADLDAHGM
ncbi:hypothetical protein D3C73_1202040 [compost metagenome]